MMTIMPNMLVSGGQDGEDDGGDDGGGDSYSSGWRR